MCTFETAWLNNTTLHEYDIGNGTNVEREQRSVRRKRQHRWTWGLPRPICTRPAKRAPCEVVSRRCFYDQMLRKLSEENTFYLIRLGEQSHH